MSVDYFSCVTIFRCNGQPIGVEEERRLFEAAKSLQFRERDRIGLFDEFDLKLGGARNENGVVGIMVSMSGYFTDDDAGNEGLEVEVLIERERPLVEQFAVELATIIGPSYEVEAYSGK